MKDLVVFVGLFSILQLCMGQKSPDLNHVEAMNVPFIKSMKVSENAPDSVRIEFTLNRPVAIINGRYAVLENGSLVSSPKAYQGLLPVHVGRDVDLRAVCRIIASISGIEGVYSCIDRLHFTVEEGLSCWSILLKTGPDVYMGCVDDFDGRALLRLEWLVSNKSLNNRDVEYVKLYFEDKAVFKVRQ